MAIQDLSWRLIREEARPGALHMALDEIAAETAGSGGPATVRVYRWTPSTLSLGYHQSIETVDRAFCAREGIDVTRRQTGGGGIYHDTHGDISYSIVLPATAVPGDLLSSYHELLEPVLDALGSMGVDAAVAEAERPAVHEPACYLRSVDPAHDVVVDGRKISGNAQYRQEDAVIQHGSITFERKTDRHLAVFEEPIEAAVFDERVTSVRGVGSVDRDSAVAALESSLAGWADAEAGRWESDELAAARELAAEKYAADEWITSY